MTVRALIADPAAPGGVRLAEVASPSPGKRQVLVEAHHVSLNRGDLNDVRTGRVPAGAVLGCDVAGIVIRAAAGGEGPAVGTRVTALASGAFAKRVAVDIESLAPVPDGVDLAQAAALPVAGLAAIQALRAGGLETPVKGSRILITGASGGVGRFAVQLAAYGGAHVIALTGERQRTADLTAAGAEQVVTDLAEVDQPVDLVLDTVGGRCLVAAWDLLAPGGSLQSIGWSCGEPATFPPYSTVGTAKNLASFVISAPVAPDLANLVRLVQAGSLSVTIAWRGPLSRIADAVQALVNRRTAGKAVLDLVARQRGQR